MMIRKLFADPHRRALLIACSATIVMLALLAMPISTGGIGKQLPWADKLVHAVMFGTLALAWWRVYQPRPWAPWMAFGIVIALSILSELMQTLLPKRSAEWSDLLADAIGALIMLGVLILHGRCRRGKAPEEGNGI